jgi:chromosome segregation ATPase
MVTYEAVAKAVEDLEREHQKPTVNNVRNKLNGGSNTKILAVLQEYFKNTRPELPPLSDGEVNQLRKLVEAASAERANKAVESYKEQIEVLEVNLKDLATNLTKQEEDCAELLEQIKKLQNENSNLTAKVEVLTTNLDSTRAEVDVANQRTQAARDELTELKLRKEDWEELKKELSKSQTEATNAKMETARLEAILKIKDQEQIKAPSDTFEPEPTEQKPTKAKTVGRQPKK